MNSKQQILRAKENPGHQISRCSVFNRLDQLTIRDECNVMNEISKPYGGEFFGAEGYFASMLCLLGVEFSLIE